MLKHPPVRIGVLCSSRAPGLAELLAHPQRGTTWDVVCVVSSESSVQERQLLRTAGVPFFARPIREFVASCGASLSDHAARREYDAANATLLAQLDVEAVVLLGYLYLLTPPLLSRFPARVVNMHDSDLTERDTHGEPRFAGLHSTRDAIAAGAEETRSSLHLVTEKLDAGPVIAVSEPYPVAAFARDAARAGHHDIVRAYAYAQREWMMRDVWGAMVGDALESFARRGAFLPYLFDERPASRREPVAVSA